MSLLVVAATRAEVAHLPPEVPVVITGLGKTAAAARTMRALADLGPRGREGLTVLNVGTAGALHDGLEGLYEPGVVWNHDISAAVLRTLDYDPQERLVVGPDPMVLASGDVFVTDADLRARLAERAALVDMEGYAVAWVCREVGVPVRMIKHVSDNADEGSMDWPALVDGSARVLGERVRQIAEMLD